MPFAVIFMVLSLALPITSALAEPGLPPQPSVPGAPAFASDELRQAIADKTIYLNVSGFELPIHYRANGRMVGMMGPVTAKFSRGDGARDSGRWWVENEQLCQRWTSWLDGKTYCYRLVRQENILYWARDDGVTGTARIED